MLTNEEKRVSLYFDNTDKPTNSSDVNNDTPLEHLNLNWSEKDLPERIRTKHVHRLHPYLGKYIPQLAEVFLRKFFKPGQVVLDPFVGSGTTLVQANELGINSIGFDISIFNVILCNAKTAQYDLKIAEKEILDILEKTTKKVDEIQGNQLSFWEKQASYQTSYLKTWFAPQSLEELTRYRTLIESQDYLYKDLLKIILSRSARSARLTTHFDLDFPKKPQTEPYWCYKHSRQCMPTQDALKFIKRYSIDTLKRIKEFSQVRSDASTKVMHGDSRYLETEMLDGIITSPPYVGLIDYHDQHAYAYHLLGLDNNSDKEIGPASKGTSIKAKQQYVEDIAAVFRKAMSNMKQGGYIIVVAADSSDLYNDIAQQAGVQVDAILSRHVNRRTGRRASEFFESIFIWRKP